MGEILRDLPGVVCHVNDVLVSGKHQREHDNHLYDVLNKIQVAGIILKQGEMHIFLLQNCISWHTTDANDISPDHSKTETIQTIKAPTTV